MILTDTGYWLALGNKKDRWHQRAIEVSWTISDDLLITWPVITEICHQRDFATSRWKNHHPFENLLLP